LRQYGSQADTLEIVGHGDPDIEGLRVLLVPQDARDADQPSRFVDRDRSEGNMVHTVHGVDQLPQGGPAERAWC
jgi:hypothetical protein